MTQYAITKQEAEHDEELAKIVATYDAKLGASLTDETKLKESLKKITILENRAKRVSKQTRQTMLAFQKSLETLKQELAHQQQEALRWKKYAAQNATGKQKLLNTRLEQKEREIDLTQRRLREGKLLIYTILSHSYLIL